MNVFISYAREDSIHANKLYDNLIEIPHVAPWLDSKNILPGIQWEPEIMKALNIADIFILLLSTNSVSKRGFVQKEITEALDKLKYIPPDQIFLIPARIDECNPKHSELNKIQYVDLFPDWITGFNQIRRAIESQLPKEILNKLTNTNQFADTETIIETINSEEVLTKRLKTRGELRGCDAMEIALTNISFASKDISGSSFVRCIFNNCNFTNSKLRGVNFEGAIFKNCEFKGADLWGVNFWGADIVGIQNIDLSIIKHTNFYNVKINKVQRNLIESNRNTVSLGDYGAFIDYFQFSVGLNNKQILTTFIWINHRYFRIMFNNI